MARSRVRTWINRFIGLHSFVCDILMIDALMRRVRRVYQEQPRRDHSRIIREKRVLKICSQELPFIDSFQEHMTYGKNSST
jgi:hypothetical protein